MSFSIISAKLPPLKSSNHYRYIYALPKMARTQFSDFCDHIVEHGWRIRQAGFGDPQVYQIYFRPGSSHLFKKKKAPLIPVWAELLRRNLPLGTRQLITLMKSREAFKIEFRDPENEERRFSVDRGGFMISQLVEKEEVENHISWLIKNLLKEDYRVHHDLYPLKAKTSFNCSYFSLKRKLKTLEVILNPRIERKGSIYRYLHQNMRSHLTSDELIVLSSFLSQIKDEFPQGTICVQSTSKEDNLKPIDLKSKIKYVIGKMTLSTEEIIDKLEQIRLFSTFLQGSSFITCPNLSISLLSRTKITRDIDLKFLTEETFEKLDQWCYDSRFLLDLQKDWNRLYPGDLPDQPE
ncbi:MAG: hypothetical protein ACFFCQ_01355 [Promethearchaeota archaeon]